MKRYREGSRAGGWTIALGMAMGAGPGMPALAQSGVVSMSGAPEQVIPRVMELGLGSFTITPTQGSVTPDRSPCRHVEGMAHPRAEHGFFAGQFHADGGAVKLHGQEGDHGLEDDILLVAEPAADERLDDPDG